MGSDGSDDVWNLLSAGKICWRWLTDRNLDEESFVGGGIF